MAMFGSRNAFNKPTTTGLLGASGLNAVDVFGNSRPKSLAEAITELMESVQKTPALPPDPTYNALAALLSPAAVGSPVPNAFISRAPAPQVSPTVTPRKVFYSFHYDDVNRVNLVRKSGKIRAIDRERRKSVFDKSLWERSRSTNPDVLKRSINRALAGTSATCILVGEHTWARPWVRYEIARSLLIGNGIFAVRIDRLWCIGRRSFGYSGPNPFDYMAVGRDERGSIYVYEHNGYGWVRFEKMQQQLLRWPKWIPDVSKGYLRPLGQGAPIYDYETDRGSDRLLIWANAAAKSAGK